MDNNNSNQVSSPTRRGGGARGLSSPWTQIVRGESDNAIAVTPSSSPSADVIEQPAAEAAVATTASASPSSSTSMTEEESSENGNGSNGGNAGKRPAWNKPSNGAVEFGPVMGASWPALSESARVSSTKSSSDSLKGLSDGSSSSSSVMVGSQGTGTAAATATATATSHSQKQVTNNAHTTSSPNHVPIRQRSMKRNGANSSSNGGALQSPGSQGAVEAHPNNPSSREHGQRNSLSRSANDHTQQQQQLRSSFRNRNGGPHSRGDGSHIHNFGGRRDQDRANQDWNTHRNFNGRDAHLQSQRGIPRFVRHAQPPPTSAPFIAPAPVHHIGNPVVYPEIPPPVYYITPAPHPDFSTMPYFAAQIPPQHVLYPAPEIHLHSKIVNQIEYYFSNDNLIKDTYLRQNMDDQGWVPIKLIAGFNKVLHLTDSIQVILDALRTSVIVEVQGDKVRRRNDWMRWIMPPVQFQDISGPLAANVQSLLLEEKNTGYSNQGQADVDTNAPFNRYGDLNSQPQLPSTEGVGQVNVQGAAYHTSENLSK